MRAKDIVRDLFFQALHAIRRVKMRIGWGRQVIKHQPDKDVVILTVRGKPKIAPIKVVDKWACAGHPRLRRSPSHVPYRAVQVIFTDPFGVDAVELFIYEQLIVCKNIVQTILIGKGNAFFILCIKIFYGF